MTDLLAAAPAAPALLSGDPDHRRAPLSAIAAPDPRQPALSTLQGRLNAVPIRVEARYIADRVIVTLDAWTVYLNGLDALSPADVPLERLALVVLGDLSNMLTPRWLEVRCETAASAADAAHTVEMEEYQPGWASPPLASRPRVPWWSARAQGADR